MKLAPYLHFQMKAYWTFDNLINNEHLGQLFVYLFLWQELVLYVFKQYIF